MQLHTNVWYDNILSKFEFQGPAFNVKVTVAISRKNKTKNKKQKKQTKNKKNKQKKTKKKNNCVITLVPTFINGF